MIEEESQPTSAPVKLMEAKKNKQKAWLLMFFMLIGLNASWVFAQSLTSDIEVNKEGVEHQLTEAFEVPDMMLMSKQVPVEIICISSLDPAKTANSTNISWKLSDARGKIVHSFRGHDLAVATRRSRLSRTRRRGSLAQPRASPSASAD